VQAATKDLLISFSLGSFDLADELEKGQRRSALELPLLYLALLVH
jgi:hypothetical protein